MKQNEHEDRLMTSEEVRQYLGIGRTKLYQLYQDPGFPAFRLGEGGAWLVRRSALNHWLDLVTQTPGKTYRFQ
jgi:excisionase family DNA binding protein